MDAGGNGDTGRAVAATRASLIAFRSMAMEIALRMRTSLNGGLRRSTCIGMAHDKEVEDVLGARRDFGQSSGATGEPARVERRRAGAARRCARRGARA